MDTVKEGRTGFQMGQLSADALKPADAAAVAETMGRACEVFGTPQYEQMVQVRQELHFTFRKYEF